MSKIGTLGPRNTNSEFSAVYYLQQKNIEGEVVLFDTPELSIDALINNYVDKAILCVVYPALNEIVFRNLESIEITELFHFHTDNMVIASSGEGGSACSHPAPKHLLKNQYDQFSYVNSNSEAAKKVAAGEFNKCVTTKSAAIENNLDIIHDYGKVPMGWAVFERK